MGASITRTAREVFAGFGWGALGCAVWLLGMLAWANPNEAKVAVAVVFVVACWALVIAGLFVEGRTWR